MKSNSMITRIISGAVLVALLFSACYFGKDYLLFLTLIFSLVGLNEYYKVTVKKDGKGLRLVEACGFILTIIYYMIIRYDPFNLNGIFMFIMLNFLLMATIYVFTFGQCDYKAFVGSFSGFYYVPFLMSFVYITRALVKGFYGVLIIFICSWICDTCAYFVGSTIGKHKLAKVLSPKKSVEGAIGGCVGATVFGVIFGIAVNKYFDAQLNVFVVGIMCFFGSVISQIGDLFASAIKRNFDTKDYGNIIPGHGGVLDRFDSVLFVAPLVFLLMPYI